MDWLGMILEIGHAWRHKPDAPHAAYPTTASASVKGCKLLLVNILHMIPQFIGFALHRVDRLQYLECGEDEQKKRGMKVARIA